jgi:hypothetical protein
MKHTVTRRDLLASIPVIALGALLFVLPPAPDAPQQPSSVAAVSAP